MSNEKNINDIDTIEEYDGEIPQEDPVFDAVMVMIRNNCPMKHIIEYSGYPEEKVEEIRWMMQRVRKILNAPYDRIFADIGHKLKNQ
jgi:hypothetical protein